MGRCYDFGVSVDPSSERAMVVAPEGGYCLSPSTGVTCEGRFDGCAEITAIAGRIPANAPSWSLPTSVTSGDNTDVAESDQEAAPIATEETRSTGAEPTPPDAPIEPGPPTEPENPSRAEPDTAPQLSSADARPRVANPDNLSSNISESPTEDTQTADLLRQIVEAADEDRVLGQARDQALSEVAENIKSLRHDLAELTDDRASTSIDDIAEEMVILREELAPSSVPSDLACAVKDAMDEMTQLRGPVQTIARAMLELKSSQEQTTYVVSALRDRLKGPLAHLERRCQTEITGPDLAAKLSELHAEIGRAQPESAQMVTAGQLADTINTLRDAGIEDISAAHLIHSLQVEMRTLRDEMVSIRGDIAELATNTARLEPA